MKERLIGVVSDSANVMAGLSGGFAPKLRTKLNADNPQIPEMNPLITHKCLAHKVQLVVRNTITKSDDDGNFIFLNFILLEKDVNDLAALHETSAKNSAHLRGVCTRRNVVAFRPKKIFPVRWVSSHYDALHLIMKFFSIIMEHLILIVSSEFFNVKQRWAVKPFIGFLSDKHALSTLHFQLDILFLLKGTISHFKNFML